MTDVKNAYETKVTSHVADGVSTAETLLEVKDLSVTLFTEDGALPAIKELSFIMRKQGRDACRGGRVWLRQVDDGALHHGPSAPASREDRGRVHQF